MTAAPTILLVTDLARHMNGRRYGDEDIYLSSRLRESFTVAIAHPLDAAALMGDFDVTVVRNSGPMIHMQAEYEAFRAAALAEEVRVFNSLTGKADMIGKRYLVDLSAAAYPVIPTVDTADDLDRLPDVAQYVVKPTFGSDSIGLRFVDNDQLTEVAFGDVLVQPRIDFRYEVSFYYIGRDFQYALYAPRPDRRWDLERYDPTAADLEFANQFVDWNDIQHGIQRVDACRTNDGELLLVELEDLNPYLSLDLLDAEIRDVFVANVKASIRALRGNTMTTSLTPGN